MTVEPSTTVEDYLLAISTISSEGQAVIAARLADALDVSPPTVTATVQRMTRDGLVTVDEHKRMRLTTAGAALAERMVRRHRLAECFLIDILGLEWADVHEEAHRFEHAISPRVEERILAVLGRPTVCPHGCIIPGTGARLASDEIPLASVAAGEDVVIDRISEAAEEDHELLTYFQRSELLPGREFRVRRIEPYNALMVLQRGGESIPISLDVARKIWVRPVR